MLSPSDTNLSRTATGTTHPGRMHVGASHPGRVKNRPPSDGLLNPLQQAALNTLVASRLHRRQNWRERVAAYRCHLLSDDYAQSAACRLYDSVPPQPLRRLQLSPFTADQFGIMGTRNPWMTRILPTGCQGQSAYGAPGQRREHACRPPPRGDRAAEAVNMLQVPLKKWQRCDISPGPPDPETVSSTCSALKASSRAPCLPTRAQATPSTPEPRAVRRTCSHSWRRPGSSARIRDAVQRPQVSWEPPPSTWSLVSGPGTYCMGSQLPGSSVSCEASEDCSPAHSQHDSFGGEASLPAVPPFQRLQLDKCRAETDREAGSQCEGTEPGADARRKGQTHEAGSGELGRLLPARADESGREDSPREPAALGRAPGPAGHPRRRTRVRTRCGELLEGLYSGGIVVRGEGLERPRRQQLLWAGPRPSRTLVWTPSPQGDGLWEGPLGEWGPNLAGWRPCKRRPSLCHEAVQPAGGHPQARRRLHPYFGLQPPELRTQSWFAGQVQRMTRGRAPGCGERGGEIMHYTLGSKLIPAVPPVSGHKAWCESPGNYSAPDHQSTDPNHLSSPWSPWGLSLERRGPPDSPPSPLQTCSYLLLSKCQGGEDRMSDCWREPPPWHSRCSSPRRAASHRMALIYTLGAYVVFHQLCGMVQFTDAETAVTFRFTSCPQTGGEEEATSEPRPGPLHRASTSPRGIAAERHDSQMQHVSLAWVCDGAVVVKRNLPLVRLVRLRYSGLIKHMPGVLGQHWGRAVTLSEQGTNELCFQNRDEPHKESVDPSARCYSEDKLPRWGTAEGSGKGTLPEHVGPQSTQQTWTGPHFSGGVSPLGEAGDNMVGRQEGGQGRPFHEVLPTEPEGNPRFRARTVTQDELSPCEPTGAGRRIRYCAVHGASGITERHTRDGVSESTLRLEATGGSEDRRLTGCLWGMGGAGCWWLDQRGGSGRRKNLARAWASPWMAHVSLSHCADMLRCDQAPCCPHKPGDHQVCSGQRRLEQDASHVHAQCSKEPGGKRMFSLKETAPPSTAAALMFSPVPHHLCQRKASGSSRGGQVPPQSHDLSFSAQRFPELRSHPGRSSIEGHCTEYLEAPVLPDQGRLLPSHGAASCEHGSQCDVNRAPCYAPPLAELGSSASLSPTALYYYGCYSSVGRPPRPA
ncbi:hypothetical protein Cadr_000028657 [Camelus dromedarius]|uniref:Uncharacterized protein n=1 Tax=Camelus dromedarius TaxID=9838 RepID=A0A5N4CHX3_CAMDR|nr:hypothetical protein Cadr_000028657 [Camelus dromedarius]